MHCVPTRGTRDAAAAQAAEVPLPAGSSIEPGVRSTVEELGAQVVVSARTSANAVAVRATERELGIRTRGSKIHEGEIDHCVIDHCL